MTIPDEQFFTIEEVAEALRVDVQTVRRWIKAGKLAAYKPGREYRVSPSALEDFLEGHSYPKVQPPLSPAKAAEERGTHLQYDFRVLLEDVVQRLEQLEQHLRAAEGDALLSALFGPLGGVPEASAAVRDLYGRVVGKEEVSEQTREAKRRLDDAHARVEALLSQGFARLTPEQRQEIQRFRRKGAETRQEQQEDTIRRPTDFDAEVS